MPVGLWRLPPSPSGPAWKGGGVTQTENHEYYAGFEMRLLMFCHVSMCFFASESLASTPFIGLCCRKYVYLDGGVRPVLTTEETARAAALITRLDIW